MRVVLDTNVFVSFLLSHGETISRIFHGWENEEYDLIVSPQISER